MIHFRTDLGSPVPELRVGPRPVVASPFAPVAPQAPTDAVSLGGSALPPRAAVAPPPPTDLKGFEIPRAALKKAALHRTPDPGEFLMAGSSTLDPHTRKHFPGMHLLASVLLGAGILTAPLTVQAQAMPSSTVEIESNMRDQMARTADLARSFGISSQTLQYSGASTALAKLRPEIGEMYKNLKPEHKKLIVDKLHDTSGFLFIQISNRDAFINGSAAGVNAFDEMQSALKENVADKKLDAGTAQKLSEAIDAFRTMTPQQRAAIVSVLEADVAALQQ
jgi:hypothetical protein